MSELSPPPPRSLSSAPSPQRQDFPHRSPAIACCRNLGHLPNHDHGTHGPAPRTPRRRTDRQCPDTEPDQIYAILTATNQQTQLGRDRQRPLSLPDERATLQIPDATPIVHATRITLGTDQCPLIFEDLRASTDHTQLAYHLTDEQPRALHAA
ncbi:hypothetical protein GCM10012285_20190 [Streptomyces kronopolitis]|uniref:FHA domain-containing protein n=1 Tax=Streptomyces kronopolitis TaxID=1612435 RepID=A0ABQ2J6G9_9ACTN|nr:hypothetical protein GCM10012285_20190 [Streptomyces kronopolitis]